MKFVRPPLRTMREILGSEVHPTLAIAHGMMLPSPQRKKISPLEMPVSQLNTQLMVSPVNASRQPSRTAAHHSGPEWLARP